VCGELPTRQRAAVVLRFYEDLDYPEIAGVLGISEVTARTHVHRALTALRARLTEEDRHG
jgi:RNA polymerase sigma factor (sigma-70 family)